MSSSIFLTGYEQLKKTLENYGKDKRVFVLFSGAKDSQGHSWCPDCVLAEKPVEETVKSSLPSNGIFIECSVGDRARFVFSWKDPNSRFRTDSKLRLTNIPTLIEWETTKRLTESQLLDTEMIKILFEED
ncbi:unnamed protein product [Rotaria sp. Silwood2]|nr:unnamed protein product [Rotaria sp. Silwood2]CAF4119033.1 unnamed protein product [Rotaria sp. Silwood2]CAF4605781.1 unnamed protein product [Rotaria sp. Silwood2]